MHIFVTFVVAEVIEVILGPVRSLWLMRLVRYLRVLRLVRSQRLYGGHWGWFDFTKIFQILFGDKNSLDFWALLPSERKCQKLKTLTVRSRRYLNIFLPYLTSKCSKQKLSTVAKMEVSFRFPSFLASFSLFFSLPSCIVRRMWWSSISFSCNFCRLSPKKTCLVFPSLWHMKLKHNQGWKITTLFRRLHSRMMTFAILALPIRPLFMASEKPQ